MRRRLAILRGVTRALAEARRVSDVLVPVMRAMVHASGATRAETFFVSCDGTQLELVARYRSGEASPTAREVATAAWVDARARADASVAAVPIPVGGAVVAVIAIHGRDLADRDLIETLDAIGKEIGRVLARLPIERAAMAELDRARAELEDLARAKEESARAVRERDRFIATLAHELRNPLAPIRAVAEMKDAEWERVRSMLERHVQHLTRVLDDVLDVSRAAHGKLAIEPSAVPLAECVNAAVEMGAPDTRAKEQELRVDVETGVWARADRSRLVQIVANLLTNASRYTPRGGRISVRGYAEGDSMVLTVKDDGVGMSPELLARAFDPFIQGPASDGLGLGLALVRSLVELHGGSVRAKSAVGAGTEIEVRLPRAPAGTIAAPIEPPAPAPYRVLIVDDNEDAAELLSALLTRAGHEVRTAPNAERAIELVERAKPDAAFLDLGLPDLDGYQLAAQIKERDPDHSIRLFALTGYGTAADRSRSLDAGFCAHLIKPVRLRDLLAALSG